MSTMKNIAPYRQRAVDGEIGISVDAYSVREVVTLMLGR